MAEGIRLVSIKQGFDPRDFALLSLGGGGSLHACALVEELAMHRVLVPRHPGVLSAAGLLAAPVEHEVSASFTRPLAALALSEVTAALATLDAEAGALMAAEHRDAASQEAARVEIAYAADVCYIGQGYHLEVPLDLDAADPLERLYRAFLTLHDRIHGHSVEGAARIVNLRTVHRLPVNDMVPAPALVVEDGDPVKTTRPVLAGAVGGALLAATVLDRAKMPPGYAFHGPAIIEQDDTTTWVPPGWHGRVLDTLMVRLDKTEGAE
jgi:N-methylhydantoinase A